MDIRYFSMYSGICGFEKGIEDAQEDIRLQRKTESNGRQGLFDRSGSANTIITERQQQQKKYINWECIGRCEIDKYAESIARYHYPNVKNYGDATRINPNELPDFDCIVAGFPCQSFSIAGKRRGFEDTRGTLFFEIIRIARVKRPSYLWLENVKGLLSHDEGNTFATIITTLDELGYDCQWQVLNSKYHGVPQNRERVFIIANIRGKRRPEIFPIGEASETSNGLQGLTVGAITARRGNAKSDGDYIIESNRETQIVQAIDANYAKGNAGFAGTKRATVDMRFLYGITSKTNKKWLDDGKDFSRNFPQGQRVYSINGISAQINCQGGGWGAKTGLYEIPNVAQALQTDGQLRSGTSWNTNNPQSARNIRRLTPIECERLQGFPDNWTKHGIDSKGKQIEISDS